MNSNQNASCLMPVVFKGVTQCLSYDTIKLEGRVVQRIIMKTNATPSNEVTKREEAHRELARQVAAESIVLLENDGVLPLAPCPLALFGAGAASTIKGGTGSGEVNERFSVTIEQGLRNAGFTITTDAWLREYEALLRSQKAVVYKAMAKRLLDFDPNTRINIMATSFQYPPGRAITDLDIRESRQEGSQEGACDTAVYVIARQAGECSDRSLDESGYSLSQAEIDHLQIITRSYPRVIVVINASGAMHLEPLDRIDGINALLFFCQQGMEGGGALADIITGGATPSGCLSSTWPKRYEDLPGAMEYSHLGGFEHDEEYREGLYVGYRYFDSFCVAPRYEFGYGLSYTGFALEHTGTAVAGTRVTLTAKATNTGSTYPGKKCVQLYVSAPSGTLRREYQSLAAFAKTGLLAPGESEEVTLAFDLTDVAAYDEATASFLLKEGTYLLRLGESSRKTEIVAAMTLDKTVVTEVCTQVCKLERKLDEIEPQEQALVEIPREAARLTLDSASIPTKEHAYQVPKPKLSPEAETLLDSLGLEDMLRLIVATGLIDGNPYFCVPGAAAYTTSHLVEKGVPNAALCDGPAGVRVQRTSVELGSGIIKPVEPMMEFMHYMPWYLRKYLLGNPRKGTTLYQHATAFPVGTALAQTWNTGLIEQVGKAMGTEMVEFGATFLLAPGMNIQRNPLCGRNYEYYSEDPLLTGKMAAALTRGVQSFEGCYVTIKHYACNNQEANRNYSNSVLSERTLREIYLRGYRTAIEEGSAKAVMTSYNKLNGVYTPNSYDLCTTLLRCEWGFDGVVMTDWLATGKGLANNGRALKAGNDLICPGGGWYLRALKKDLANGLVSVEDIRLACARVLEAIMNGRTGKAAGLTQADGDCTA